MEPKPYPCSRMGRLSKGRIHNKGAKGQRRKRPFEAFVPLLFIHAFVGQLDLLPQCLRRSLVIPHCGTPRSLLGLRKNLLRPHFPPCCMDTAKIQAIGSITSQRTQEPHPYQPALARQTGPEATHFGAEGGEQCFSFHRSSFPPVSRQAMTMSNRGNHHSFPADEIGDMIGEYRTIDASVAAPPLSPQVRLPTD